MLKVYLPQILLRSTSCPSFTKKLSKKIEKQTNKQTQFEEARQASEPDKDMAETLKLSEQKFKTTLC